MDEPVRRDRKQERHDQTKREILDAAWALAAARGLAGWSLRDVADTVGMRPPSLYVYFDSKSAVYDALFADGCRELLARIDDAVPADTDPLSRLRAGAHLFFDFCIEEPARYQLLFLRTVPGFAPTPASYALAQEAVDRLAVALADAGISDPAGVDLWTALLTGLVSQQVSNDPGGQRWARLVDRAVDMLLTSVGAPLATG